MSLTLIFSFHRQQWAAVMEELVYSTPCVDDDDDYHSCYVDEENWNAECDEYAAYIDRRLMLAAVMAEMVKKSCQSPTPTRFVGQAWPLAAAIDHCSLILTIIETMTNNNVITVLLFTMICLYFKQ